MLDTSSYICTPLQCKNANRNHWRVLF